MVDGVSEASRSTAGQVQWVVKEAGQEVNPVLLRGFWGIGKLVEVS